jgi:hypothetical protein
LFVNEGSNDNNLSVSGIKCVSNFCVSLGGGGGVDGLVVVSFLLPVILKKLQGI